MVQFSQTELISFLTQAFTLSSTRASSGVWKMLMYITGGRVIENFNLDNIIKWKGIKKNINNIIH